MPACLFQLAEAALSSPTRCCWLTVSFTALASWLCTELAAALCRKEALVASRRCSSEPIPAVSFFLLAAAAAAVAGAAAVPALRFLSLAAESIIR